MPTYEIDIPGQGTFTVNSPRELTDEEAYSAALRGGVAPQASAAASETPGPVFGQDFSTASPELPTEAPDRGGYGQRVGRRVGEAVEAFKSIPSNLADVVTGGEEGGVMNRVVSALKVAQGVFAPSSIILSPVEAAAEYVAKEAFSEPVSELVGSAAGIAASLGVGSAAAAGKLGRYGSMASRAVGMGRTKDINTQLAHDPSLRYIMTRNVESEAMARAREGLYEPSLVKGASKLPPHPMDDLAAQQKYWNPNQPNLAQDALDADIPNVASAALKSAEIKSDQWGEFAKANRIVGEIPAAPSVDWKKLAMFQVAKFADAGLWGTLGTPLNRWANNPIAYNAASTMALAETKRNDYIINQLNTHHSNLATVGDKDLRRAALLYHTKEFEEIGTLHAAGKINDNVYQAARYIHDTVEKDRVEVIPMLRSQAMEATEKRVRREWDNAKKDFSPTDLDAEVVKRLTKRFPDSMSMDEILAETAPGYFTIYGKNGERLGTAGSKWEVRDVVHDFIRNGEDISHVDTRAYFDADVLGQIKTRVGRAITGLSNAMKFGDDELAALKAGDFTVKKKHGVLGQLVENVGAKGSNYERDVVNALSLYNRQISRFRMMDSIEKPVKGAIRELEEKGYTGYAHMVRETLKEVRGFRHPLGVFVDNTIKATPLLRDMIMPYALERFTGGTKTAMVNLMLKYNPRYQMLNATQTLQTLWNVVDTEDFMQGLKLLHSAEGKALLEKHGKTASYGKVEDFLKTQGPIERHNQQQAFLTMYNKARKLGLSDQDAADYGVLRGQFFTQFLGATADRPYAFRKLDPFGMITMFQRFPIKQYEQMFEAIKDRDFPAAGKWLFVNLALGGMRAATLGQGGWLTYKAYKDIESEYGKGMADLWHIGLPSFAGVDISNSVMLFNPPMGQNFAEKLGNVMLGPLGSIGMSAWGAAAATGAPEPNAKKRIFDALVERMPLAREIKRATQLVEGNYDMKDPLGRMKYKADAKDLMRGMLGFKTLNESQIDGFAQALFDVVQKRNRVLDHVSSTYAQAAVAGVDLGGPMTEMLQKEVNGWNGLFPEFPISGDEILRRGAERAKAAQQDTVQRMLRRAPEALKQSRIFQPPDWMRPGGG